MGYVGVQTKQRLAAVRFFVRSSRGLTPSAFRGGHFSPNSTHHQWRSRESARSCPSHSRESHDHPGSPWDVYYRSFDDNGPNRTSGRLSQQRYPVYLVTCHRGAVPDSGRNTREGARRMQIYVICEGSNPFIQLLVQTHSRMPYCGTISCPLPALALTAHNYSNKAPHLAQLHETLRADWHYNHIELAINNETKQNYLSHNKTHSFGGRESGGRQAGSAAKLRCIWPLPACLHSGQQQKQNI